MSLLRVEINQAGYKAGSILRDVHFSIESGELVGLIGANGAGKSTTIKSILGFIEQMDGTIRFEDKNRYAYVPEQPIFYDELTLKEHLDFAGAVMSIKDETLKERSEELLNVFHLKDSLYHLPNTFWKGMQQKVMLILAFLIKPDLYIIDEPFIGLDPHATKDFIDLINREKQRGAGILMSTHVLDTAEKYCDRFLLLKKGSLLASGRLQDLQERANQPQGSLFECYTILAGDTPDDRD
jgi:ABC-2 type transport system ATP-binding protein